MSTSREKYKRAALLMTEFLDDLREKGPERGRIHTITTRSGA